MSQSCERSLAYVDGRFLNIAGEHPAKKGLRTGIRVPISHHAKQATVDAGKGTNNIIIRVLYERGTTI